MTSLASLLLVAYKTSVMAPKVATWPSLANPALDQKLVAQYSSNQNKRKLKKKHSLATHGVTSFNIAAFINI